MEIALKRRQLPIALRQRPGIEVAEAITAMLLYAIRNEWDLITWITPRGPDAPRHDELR